MFEHATLQEAYTGALIAGKGKALNNINVIMERSKTKNEDWVRVRFGAGTPWRRCWCVISPPEEKQYQKLQKEINKKKSVYDRSRPPILKGDLKFYDSRKVTKKTQPIATIADVYSAFAIYPQSKPLIDQSTLVKVEGTITIHSSPPTATEGFVFVMPEVHPAVSGFEMMLRWLFPLFDTFALYGRPGRLIADTLDPRSLMFAMPRERRYGYLEILDVSSLILTDGSQGWREVEWRRKMKELTAKRMSTLANVNKSSRMSINGPRSSRSNLATRSHIGFDDSASIKSSPSIRHTTSPGDIHHKQPGRVDSAPPAATSFTPPLKQSDLGTHHRSQSETHNLDRYQNQNLPPFDSSFDSAPTPPPHGAAYQAAREGSSLRYRSDMAATPERVSSEDESGLVGPPVRELEELQVSNSVQPVATPPAFAHGPGALPISIPYHSAELRRENSRMSVATLTQLAGASPAGASAAAAAAAMRANGNGIGSSNERARHNVSRQVEDMGQSGVNTKANNTGTRANIDGYEEGLVAESSGHAASGSLHTTRSLVSYHFHTP